VPELAAAVASWAARAVVLAATDNTNNGQININSQNLNILSSQDTNNTKSNTKHKNLNVSYTVYGTNSGGLSGSILKMGLAFGCFNEFWWFFFKNSGFVFNERVGLYFYDKRVAFYFFLVFLKKRGWRPFFKICKNLKIVIANTNLNTPNKTTTIVDLNLQANANNAVNSDNANNAVNTNNGQININSQNLNRVAFYFFLVFLKKRGWRPFFKICKNLKIVFSI
jgi:ATP-dependent Zn protease